MGRHAAADAAATDPIDVAGVWPTLELPVRRRGLWRSGRARPGRGRPDGQLAVTGCMLLGLGAVCGVLSLLTAGRMPQVAAWAWAVGGVTAWALSFTRWSATPG